MLADVEIGADPYPPSWVNRLHAWIDTLPVAAWVVYLMTFLSVVLVSHAFAWVDGYVPVGSLDPYFAAPAFYLVLGYGGIHFLDRIASRAWTVFRPLVSLDDEEAGRVAYVLVTMPVRPVLVCVVLGIVTAVTYFLLQYGRPFDLSRGPLTVITGLPLTCVIFAGTWTLFYHSLHQLRIIGRIHGYVASIDLLHLERSHAFASVTAATGLALLALGYVGVPTTPGSLTNPQVIAWAALTTTAAVVCFVVPLNGIRGLIAAEKSRRLEAINRLLGQALGDLHRRVGQGDRSDATAIKDQVSSLLTERDVVARVSTWPWSPGTLRGFGTAIVLPVVLWLVYRVLERQLG
jgi:hypothetical protein